MVSLQRRALGREEEKELVAFLIEAHQRITRTRMHLPLRSPARAALGTLLTQIAEVVGYVTGDHGYFEGKAHEKRSR